MKRRVVPIETVETFLETLQILFYGSPRQPNYDGLRELFLKDSFEIEDGKDADETSNPT